MFISTFSSPRGWRQRPGGVKASPREKRGRGAGDISRACLIQTSDVTSAAGRPPYIVTISGAELQNCDIPLLFSFQRVLLLVGLFYTGLLPFVPFREQFLEIPMPSIIMKLKDPSKMSRSHKFVVWLADALIMRKALFEHLKARGIQVYIWVLNNEEEYKRAFDLGATGVMTDYPTRLKKFLESYPY